MLLINICFIFFLNKALAICDCDITLPKELRLKKLSYGVGYTRFEKELGETFHTDKSLFEQLFKLHVAKFNNISGSVIRFNKAPKDVYRSAILSENIALLSELVKTRNVKSIVVLTNSKIFNIAPWIDKEKAVFAVLGGTQFIHILDFDCDFDFKNSIEVQVARNKVRSIIQIIANVNGNVLIHCLGGEHRTEVIFEVMQKCLNNMDMENITKRYKCHTGWESMANKGNFRQDNIDFIRDFPCESLNNL
jgi:hypothetical protein